MPSMMATEMNYVVPGILVKAHVLSVIYRNGLMGITTSKVVLNLGLCWVCL